MNDRQRAVNEDIAYMRDLAEAGATTPLLGGPVLALAGGIYGTATVAQWVLMQLDADRGSILFPLWIVVHLVFFVSIALPIKAMKRRPGAQSPTNRATGFAWSTTGWSILLLSAAAAIIAWRTGNGMALALAPSVVTTIYGSAWLLSLYMSQQKWLLAPALGSYAFSLILALLIQSPHLYLAMGLAMYLVALVPGLVMMRREPSLVV